MTEQNRRETDRRETDPIEANFKERRMPATWLIGAMLTIFTFVWSGGMLYQRIIFLETWKIHNETSLVHQQDLDVLLSHIEAERHALEQKHLADIAAERTFSRALCVALSHTQAAAGIPVTNDCDRP